MTGQLVGTYGRSFEALEVTLGEQKVIVATGLTWPDGGMKESVAVWCVVDNAKYGSPVREIPPEVEEMVKHYLQTGEKQRMGFRPDGTVAKPPTKQE